MQLSFGTCIAAWCGANPGQTEKQYGETVRRYSPLLSSTHMLHVAYGYLRIAIIYRYIYTLYVLYVYIYTYINLWIYSKYTLVYIYTLCKMYYILDILCIVYYILYLLYYITSYIMQLWYIQTHHILDVTRYVSLCHIVYPMYSLYFSTSHDDMPHYVIAYYSITFYYV